MRRRATVTSSVASRLSPKKQLAATARSRRFARLKWLPQQNAKRGRHPVVNTVTPAVDFHGYAVADVGCKVFQEKLERCEEIMPGISDIVESFDIFEAKSKRLSSAVLSLENVKNDNDTFEFWAGLPSYGVFFELFKFLEPRAKTLRYWKGDAASSHDLYSERCVSKPGPDRKLSPVEEFFLTLVRLRVGLLLVDLAS